MRVYIERSIILDSSMVEHAAVNRGVVGSSPTRGARLNNLRQGMLGAEAPSQGASNEKTAEFGLHAAGLPADNPYTAPWSSG